MRKTWCAVGVATLLLAAGLVHSDDAAEPRAVIDRAIKALGGEANLGKFKAVSMRGKGTYYGNGDGIPYTGEWDVQPPDREHVVIESSINGQNFRFMSVLSGNKGWIKFNDDVKDMSKEQIAEEKEKLHADEVGKLVTLKDKAFKLASLGELDVQGQKAVGVRVSHKDHRDVLLYFDKKSGLPVKTETITKDILAGGNKEITQEALMIEYKEFDGVKHASKVVLMRDGKRYVEAEFTEIRPVEKLDDSLFARP
jgi:hypothetical protein